MSIVLDLIVLAIILFTVFMSAKRGFVRVALEVVGFIAAVFITFTISTPLGNITYDKIIEPPIVSSVSSAAGESTSQVVDKTWDSLPEFVKNNSEKIGISKEKIDKSIGENIGEGAEAAVKSASQNAVKPVVVRILSLIYSVFILIILLFLVKILAKFINRLFSFSLVGKMNRVLGGILGIPKGIIIAIAFCLIISLAVSFTSGGFLIFTKDAIDNSWFFSHFSVNLLKLG